MSIKLVDTLESMGNFPVANADGIQFTDGESLQKKLDDGSLGGGGATAESYIELSEEEYLALSDEERASEVEYRTYDTGRIFKRGVEYGKDGVQISDVETVENKTWSSQKTSDEIAKVETELKGNIEELSSNLGELCNKKIYCGEVTGTIVNGVISEINPIGKVGNAIATIKYAGGGNPFGYSITTQVTLSALNFYFRWHRESDGAEAYPPDGIKITISYMIFY